MPKPRVIIADDHTLLAEAFEKLLAPECDVVAKAADGRALLAAVQEFRPDVVILDVAMPLLNGLDAGRRIKQSHPSVKLVFVTMNEDPDLAAEAFRAGGVGVPAEALGGVGAARCDQGSDEASILRDATRDRRHARLADARGATRKVADATHDSPARGPAVAGGGEVDEGGGQHPQRGASDRRLS